MILVSAQCRGARAMLDMDQAVLATQAHVSRNVVVDFETGRRTPTANNLAALRAVLEKAGAVFLADVGEGPGVRLRKPLQTTEDLSGRIEVLEAKVAGIPETDGPSPESGMNVMRKALAENELTGLRNARKRMRKPKAT